MEQSLKPKLTLVFGRICSGKGFYTKNSDYTIVVSNLVRAIVNSASRDALQNSLHLDEQIAESILYTIDVALEQHKTVAVDGIRQVSIVNKVLQYYPDAELVWLEVPTEERKRRYESRKDVKDVELFEVADNKPIELECQKIFGVFRERLTIVHNY